MYVLLAMTATTNPRSVYTSGNATVISIPKAFREEAGIEQGDKFVLEATDSGFKAVKVEFRKVNHD